MLSFAIGVVLHVHPDYLGRPLLDVLSTVGPAQWAWALIGSGLWYSSRTLGFLAVRWAGISVAIPVSVASACIAVTLGMIGGWPLFEQRVLDVPAGERRAIEVDLPVLALSISLLLSALLGLAMSSALARITAVPANVVAVCSGDSDATAAENHLLANGEHAASSTGDNADYSRGFSYSREPSILESTTGTDGLLVPRRHMGDTLRHQRETAYFDVDNDQASDANKTADTPADKHANAPADTPADTRPPSSAKSFATAESHMSFVEAVNSEATTLTLPVTETPTEVAIKFQTFPKFEPLPAPSRPKPRAPAKLATRGIQRPVAAFSPNVFLVDPYGDDDRRNDDTVFETDTVEAAALLQRAATISSFRGVSQVDGTHVRPGRHAAANMAHMERERTAIRNQFLFGLLAAVASGVHLVAFWVHFMAVSWIEWPNAPYLPVHGGQTGVSLVDGGDDNTNNRVIALQFLSVYALVMGTCLAFTALWNLLLDLVVRVLIIGLFWERLKIRPWFQRFLLHRSPIPHGTLRRLIPARRRNSDARGSSASSPPSMLDFEDPWSRYTRATPLHYKALAQFGRHMRDVFPLSVVSGLVHGVALISWVILLVAVEKNDARVTLQQQVWDWLFSLPPVWLGTVTVVCASFAGAMFWSMAWFGEFSTVFSRLRVDGTFKSDPHRGNSNNASISDDVERGSDDISDDTMTATPADNDSEARLPLLPVTNELARLSEGTSHHISVKSRFSWGFAALYVFSATLAVFAALVLVGWSWQWAENEAAPVPPELNFDRPPAIRLPVMMWQA